MLLMLNEKLFIHLQDIEIDRLMRACAGADTQTSEKSFIGVKQDMIIKIRSRRC